MEQALLKSRAALRYYKVTREILKSDSGVSTWCKYITKRGNYYKKGPYTFMTLGQMETHVCLLIRSMRFESGVLYFDMMCFRGLKPNKAGLFEGSFSLGGGGGGLRGRGQLNPLHISRRTYLISI